MQPNEAHHDGQQCEGQQPVDKLVTLMAALPGSPHPTDWTTTAHNAQSTAPSIAASPHHLVRVEDDTAAPSLARSPTITVPNVTSWHITQMDDSCLLGVSLAFHHVTREGCLYEPILPYHTT